LKGPIELLFPPPRVFHCIRVHSFIGTAVRVAIGLIVSFKVYATSGDPTVDRRFPNSAFGRPTVKFKVPWPSNID
jgi:hypothetical protein